MSRKSSRILYALLVLIFSFNNALAIELVGEGYGKNEMEARKSALADLSSAIQVQVQSEFESIEGEVQGEYYSDVKQLIHIKSDLPILGASYDSFPTKPEMLIRAALKSNNVLHLYDEKLKEITGEATSHLKALEEAKGNRKHEIMNELITLIDQYYKYKTVAVMLGSHRIPDFPVTRAEIKNRLSMLESNIDTIDLAVKLIAKNIDRKGIYIYPPTTRDSHEVTPFGSVVKNRLSAYLNTVQRPLAAKYTMRGNYEILNDGIELTYHLVDSEANTIKSKVIRLSQESYQGYRYRPQTINFDKLLHEGIVVSNDFRLELSSNRGKTNLIYGKGEEFELFVKSNRSGYFYIVGHVVKPKGKYSYLLELQDAPGKRKFINFINADDANKWISLGKFNVMAPFGVESLQAIASTKDIIDSLPSTEYDGKSELYMISGNVEESVVMTRALVRKKENKALSAEAVLMFTTMEN
jgi:hypothetical protein